MINACERCSKIVKNWKYSQKFQRTRLSYATNPLIIKYNNLLKRDEIAVEAMVNYEGCVNQADPQKPTRRAPEDPDNILAMRLGVLKKLFFKAYMSSCESNVVSCCMYRRPATTRVK